MAKSKSHHVAFRVADHEWELIQDDAKRRDLSEGKVARALVLDALTGFYKKQGRILRRFDLQNDLLELLIRISSLSAAGQLFPLMVNGALLNYEKN
ncbi:hypothetical protein [Gallionella capsiferriformans]|uniref:Uncharacterized protein n=1 Tax=Gallionella capsiferriformans (strain ES-2) TaxID=395494 RepID=D9SH46_GALCS|nr:hypothetical protein [Gallionella capsiferriformans]ADL55843.1 hypothetical protein Galf_1833 [Gallionella capsiferriformans ES-2]